MKKETRNHPVAECDVWSDSLHPSMG